MFTILTLKRKFVLITALFSYMQQRALLLYVWPSLKCTALSQGPQRSFTARRFVPYYNVVNGFVRASMSLSCTWKEIVEMQRWSAVRKILDICSCFRYSHTKVISRFGLFNSFHVSSLYTVEPIIRIIMRIKLSLPNQFIHVCIGMQSRSFILKLGLEALANWF